MPGSERQQDARLDHHLKTVADAEDQLAVGLEVGPGVGQVMLDLVGQDAAGGHVVAVAESARQAENLESLEQPGLLQQAVDVERFGLRPRFLEGEGGFLVAVGAGGSQDQDVGRRHWLGARGWGLGTGELYACGFAILLHHLSGFCHASFRVANSAAIVAVAPRISNFPPATTSPTRACGTPAKAASNSAARSGRTSQRNRVFDSAEQQHDVGQIALPRHVAQGRAGRPGRRRRPSRRRPRPGRPRSGRGRRGPGRRGSPGARPRRTAGPAAGSTCGHLRRRRATRPGRSASRPVSSRVRPTRYRQLPGSFRSIVTQRRTSSTWPRALISSDGGMAIGSAAPWGGIRCSGCPCR